MNTLAGNAGCTSPANTPLVPQSSDPRCGLSCKWGTWTRPGYWAGPTRSRGRGGGHFSSGSLGASVMYGIPTSPHIRGLLLTSRATPQLVSTSRLYRFPRERNPPLRGDECRFKRFTLVLHYISCRFNAKHQEISIFGTNWNGSSLHAIVNGMGTKTKREGDVPHRRSNVVWSPTPGLLHRAILEATKP